MITEIKTNFVQAGEQYVIENLRTVEEKNPYSPEFYFTSLLAKGIEARKKENYGIAAGYVIRRGNTEVIFFGQNNIISDNNPHGHAEMNAVQNARETFTRPIFDDLNIIVGYEPRSDDEISNVLARKQEYGTVIVRPAPENSEDAEFLITTLEPCPQCTVGSIKNVSVETVVIGAADPFAGQVIEGRIDHLSPLWSDPKITVTPNILVMQSENPDDPNSYVPEKLLRLLTDLFFQTKDPLDAKIKENKTGFLVIPGNIEALAQ